MTKSVLTPEEKKAVHRAQIKKWKEDNKQHCTDYSREAMRRWVADNRERYNKQKHDYYHWKKISTIFRNILLD